MDRATADYMGMLATVINALALQDALEKARRARPACCPPSRCGRWPSPTSAGAPSATSRRAAWSIFAAGTGNPFFTTDTAGALRAVEIGAEAILKATKVDGIYTADPRRTQTRCGCPRSRYIDVLSGGLKVMDATAISLCMENKLPIVVFDLTPRRQHPADRQRRTRRLHVSADCAPGTEEGAYAHGKRSHEGYGDPDEGGAGRART